MGELGRDLTEIAALMIGLALVATLVVHSSGTAQVISAGTSGFSNVLSTATFQGGGSFGGVTLGS